MAQFEHKPRNFVSSFVHKFRPGHKHRGPPPADGTQFRWVQIWRARYAYVFSCQVTILTDVSILFPAKSVVIFIGTDWDFTAGRKTYRFYALAKYPI